VTSQTFIHMQSYEYVNRQLVVYTIGCM